MREGFNKEFDSVVESDCFVQNLLYEDKDNDDEEVPIQYVESGSDSKEEESQEECNSPVFIDLKQSVYKSVNRATYRSIKSLKHIEHTRK